MEIQDIQKHARELREKNGWNETTAEQRVLYLVSEVGELAQDVLSLTGNLTDTDTRRLKEHLGMEMYDVVWNVCDLANLLGLDLEEAFTKKHAENMQRSWAPE